MELSKINPTKLLWIDMEMTGLDPQKCRIVEVAAIITDWNFKELDSLELVVRQSQEVIDSMEDFPRIHHAASGLTPKILNGTPEAEAEAAVCELVKKHFGDQPALLAGNSIHQDRQFIKQWWSRLDAMLHYRMLDVSAWKVVMIGKYNIQFQKSEKHRALDDIRESIAELKFYLDKAKFTNANS